MDEDEPTQLRFEDGALVGLPGSGVADAGVAAAKRIAPGDRTGFVLAPKEGALAVNDVLAADVDEHGRRLSFGSRSHAEEYARECSALDGALRVQAAPANDPAEVDAYLLADHDPSVREPAAVDGDTWTFDVGANCYGALGEAVLLEPPRPHALAHFVGRDLGVDPDEVHLDVERGTVVAPATGTDEDGPRWVPDCTLLARDGAGGPVLERYYCEIKTGEASFERSQRAAMERLARAARVLAVRVDVEDLPDSYDVRIEAVAPPE